MIQQEAQACDATAQFPHDGFAALRDAGVLRATLPVARGGDGFGDGAAGAEALFKLLYRLGESSLSVARIYEAHANALQLILRYGTPDQISQITDSVLNGHLFALWVTDPPAGGVVLEGALLHGAKAFCSAAGVATRALITAQTPQGAQMLVVTLDDHAKVLPDQIKLGGMRAAITGAVDFTGMAIGADALLGSVGDYLREPVFSAGAWRGSAAALGGLAGLIEQYRAELLRRGRGDDPHQRARFGQVLIAHETARLWVTQTAQRACLEDDTPAAVVAYVNAGRIAVETQCLDAMRNIQRSLGLSAFMAGHPAERMCRDLATYLRQPAPDETLDKAAGHYLTADLPWPN